MKIRWGAMMLLAVLVTGCGADAPPTDTASAWNLQGPGPHLVAHYLPWYETTASADSDEWTWTHWKWDGPGPKHDPAQVREDGRRDLAAVVTPLIGPYASWSETVLDYHFGTMRAAGIEAAIVLWYGPDNPIDSRITPILDAAQRHGMKAAICYEEKLNWSPYNEPELREDIVATATEHLRYIVQTYASHPAYLRRDGKPFICQFNYWGLGELGPNNIQPDEWKSIFAAMPEPIVYARQNLDEDQHPTVDGAYVWWAPDNWPQRFADRAQQMVESGDLTFYMTMICPGFDDTGVWGWGNKPRKSEAYGLPVLRSTFDEAVRTQPELVQIVTWNDFNEATVVEPSYEHGFAFVDALESWWGRRFGRPVNLNDNRAAFEAYVKACSPQQRKMLPLLSVPVDRAQP